jgi:MFS transporter, CP family, cyanate transporter
VNRTAVIILAAGVCAAMHVAKLPPAVPALQQAMGLTLVQAGFLLSLVQLAGMCVGLAVGAMAEGLGLKRSLWIGLATLAVASALGGFADSASALMVLRALEGFGFLLSVLAAPALLRRLATPAELPRLMGWWGSYIPMGTAAALLLGPLVLSIGAWSLWWWLLAVVTAAMGAAVYLGVPGDEAEPPRLAANGTTAARPAVALAWHAWLDRLKRTLSKPGPWLVSLTFALYSSQWLAVVGFLPTMANQLGMLPSTVALMTALVAAVNLVGNVWGGRRLAAGASPRWQLWMGLGAMMVSSLVAFSGLPGHGDLAQTDHLLIRYGALLSFSAFGGLVPATLFVLATRVAPSADTMSSTVGWIQQWSALGQFAGPPAAAWLAERVGGWQWTGVLTGGLALVAVFTAWFASHVAVQVAGSAKPTSAPVASKNAV